MPSITALRDPGLNAPSSIIPADGDVCFINIGDDRVGRVRHETVQLFAAPPGAIRFPANIFPGSDRRMWFSLRGIDAVAARSILAQPIPRDR